MAIKEKPLTKVELANELAEETGLTRIQITAVLNELPQVIQRQLSGVGMFNLPGLLKIRKVRKPARAEREGVNPFTGEQITFKAKPAYNGVKVTPLKALKEMVQ
jgi:nucleoid DNA-binding protein